MHFQSFVGAPWTCEAGGPVVGGGRARPGSSLSNVPQQTQLRPPGHHDLLSTDLIVIQIGTSCVILTAWVVIQVVENATNIHCMTPPN